MQIEFASIMSSEELCERLEDELPLGKTNISEVQDFLSRQELEHSDIIIRSDFEPSMIYALLRKLTTATFNVVQMPQLNVCCGYTQLRSLGS